MRIMEIVSGTALNGAIQHCLLLTRHLARRGHAMTLVCRPQSWIAAQLAADPVEVIFSDLHRWPPDELRRIASVIRQRRIDLVHTHMSRAHFFGVLLRWFSGAPCVATAHNRLIQLHWMFNDLVIAVSEATRRYQQTRNLVRADRIVTIHNFIDDRPPTELSPEVRSRIRASLAADESSLLVAVIGHVIPRKGLIYLIRALPEVSEAIPGVRVAFVGQRLDVAYAARVEATAVELGLADRIVWTGQRSDVPELMAAMDLCVMPSLEESLPLVLLEAMAAGLPVVGTTVGGIPECVVPEETGLLVPPADPHALAQAMIALLADPDRRRRFGEAGRQRVRNHFSCQSQVAAIEAAFQQVLRRRAA